MNDSTPYDKKITLEMLTSIDIYNKLNKTLFLFHQNLIIVFNVNIKDIQSDHTK